MPADRLKDMKQPFERIVTVHADTVLRVCRAVLGTQDADDAWSETFLAAIRAYPDLPDGANVEAWLVTIAHRKSIDVIRKRQRHAIPVEEVPDQPSSIGIPGASDHDLWNVVRALPARQRQAVAYHYVAGLPYADIAEIVGGTADAARRAAADGIKTLRATYPGAHRPVEHRPVEHSGTHAKEATP
jgi:RNA polymerase sigma factor (sigma-70 family)